MTSFESEFKKIVRSASKGESINWSAYSYDFKKDFINKVTADQLKPLFYFWLEKNQGKSTCPAELLQNLRREANRGALLAAQRKIENLIIAEEFKKQNVPFLIIKGAALTYTVYPEPILRPQCDTDFFISEQDKERAFLVLENLGYSQDNTSMGEFMGYQCVFRKAGVTGNHHFVDLHWRLSNALPFADIFTFEEAKKSAVDIPDHGDGVQTLGERESLLFACVHLVGHHFNEENVLWLYDIYLLSLQKTSAWFKEFQALAEEKKVWVLCASIIKEAHNLYGSNLPESFIEQIKIAKFKNESSAAYLNRKRKWLHDIVFDFKYLKGADKLRYLQERVFPSKEYMLKKYPKANPALLPALYFYRFLGGLYKVGKRIKP